MNEPMEYIDTIDWAHWSAPALSGPRIVSMLPCGIDTGAA